MSSLCLPVCLWLCVCLSVSVSVSHCLFLFLSVPSHQFIVLISHSSSLLFNSCRSTGRQRYSATPPDLVPCSLLRSSSVSCFPAPSQLSSSMCSLVFLYLDNLEGSISELFSLYCCQLSSLCAQSKSTSYE